jgi:hypothetical protein
MLLQSTKVGTSHILTFSAPSNVPFVLVPHMYSVGSCSLVDVDVDVLDNRQRARCRVMLHNVRRACTLLATDNMVLTVMFNITEER